MRILAIDPGPVQSAVVWFVDGDVLDGFIWKNEAVGARIVVAAHENVDAIAIEWVESFGMPVGKDVFETVAWSGRFWELAEQRRCEVARVPRREVKLHLCNSARAKDANIRQALIDKFGPGKEKAIGKKASPGPLYGIKSHLWAALAVAVTCAETRDVVGLRTEV